MRQFPRSADMGEGTSLDNKHVWVAGETGMVGRALVGALAGRRIELISAPRASLDLTDQRATYEFLSAKKPDIIFVAAARVGGIGANSQYPADFIRDNLAIAQNVIDGAHRAGIDRLIFLGSSCIYPKHAPQPIREDALLTGPLEPTNEAYAIAKIAGVKLCEFYSRQYGRNYVAAMPTNLYGPHDRFDIANGHVIPAMIAKFHKAAIQRAASVDLWGSGCALREFLHVDDLAAALVMLADKNFANPLINIGSGEEISIADLAAMIAEITGFKGRTDFDVSMPDGTPRKLLDSSKISGLGWRPRMTLEQGLIETYRWYCANQAIARAA